MKTTLALYWKSLVAKIHPPLPISPRDSQKLVSVLNASFRKQLEGDPPRNSNEGEASTDRHLKSILTNPLFQANKNLATPRSSKRDNMSIGEMHHVLERPMEAFQHRLFAGTADLETAKLCLTLQLKICMASSSTNIAESLAQSKAGSIVLNWLWSSGLAESGTFMLDMEFIRVLEAFIAAEQKHHRALDWIRLLAEQVKDRKIDGLYKAIQRMQSYIALRMMKAEVEYGCGIESATRLFVDWLDRKIDLSVDIFRPAGCWLTARVSKTMNAEVHQSESFCPFIRSIQTWSAPLSFEHAWQGVHHPEQKNAHHALQYLQKLSPQSISTMSAGPRLETVLMGLKAADLLLSESDQAGAVWIMDFLQVHFADDLGIESQKKQAVAALSDRYRNEESSVRLLESLATH